MISAGSILKNLTRELRIESAVKLAELQTKWQHIFDESLCRHIYPADIKDDILIIKVDSPVWMQQLSYLKVEIGERLKGFSPIYTFKDIIFKLGRFPKSKAYMTNQNTKDDKTCIDEIFMRNQSQNIPEWANDLLSEVKDEYLHNSIKNIIAFNLYNGNQ